MTGIPLLREAAPAASLATHLGRMAVRALFDEAVLDGKPGLVGAASSGAHDDMTLATFYRSMIALRPYFPAMATLGAENAPWTALRTRALSAEAEMLQATGGVNTHRGAIFHLGLLCAAAGALAVRDRALTAAAVCGFVRAAHAPHFARDATGVSHGAVVRQRYGAGGARAEAASGYRSVRRWSLPALRAILVRTNDRERAAVQALFALVASVADTNVLWRGGSDGLVFAQARAREFLSRGGVLAVDWRARATSIHREFVERRLSPGGCADLLAVTLFLGDIAS